MLSSQLIQEKVIAYLKAEAARTPDKATAYEFWTALSRLVMEILADDWQRTTDRYLAGRQAHYFSAEFLEGRSLLNNLINLGLLDTVREAIAPLGFDLARLEEQETDPGLGNGGLGRLAACFLDSCATLNLPVTGYGILYRFGLFRQAIENGFQKEYPDAWMEEGYPFLVRREQDRVRIHYQDLDVFAVPYDLPVTGFQTANINTLRLWRAEPAEAFDFGLFNAQRFDDSVAQHNRIDDIFRVIYPNDTSYDGKVLRVRQQYFFVSASLHNIVNLFRQAHADDFSLFAQLNVIQLNDTHPVLAIPELLRILMEEHGLAWETAWPITRQVFAYTNHTVMAEALEKWDIGIFQFLFPNLNDMICRIDTAFREEAAALGLNNDQASQLAPIGDGKVRMAWLASFAAFSINGVAAMHTAILQKDTLHGFYQLWPAKFSNKTNGVTPRRWLHLCNPGLAALLTELSGSEAWVTNLDQLARLTALAADDAIMSRLIDIKKGNKQRLADYVQASEDITVDPASLFDVQVKRLHEYKRQLLNALLILDQYFLLKDHPETSLPPCTFFFGAKAAPGYYRARGIIKFINEIKKMINRDPDMHGRLCVVFIKNYGVSKAELIFPAADVSEQISTVGMEASGTGNMKFMMNGAVTIGTCDGANVEIAEAAGDSNCYLFGCKIEDFAATRAYYNPQWQYQNIPGLRRCVDTLVNGTFNDSGTGMFQDLYNGLIYGSNWQPADPYYVLGDFDEYRSTRMRLLQDYRHELEWARKCWVSITSSGRFSSDRTIREYAAGIWRIEGQPIY
jgi:starch phosphorylase